VAPPEPRTPSHEEHAPQGICLSRHVLAVSYVDSSRAWVLRCCGESVDAFEPTVDGGLVELEAVRCHGSGGWRRFRGDVLLGGWGRFRGDVFGRRCLFCLGVLGFSGAGGGEPLQDGGVAELVAGPVSGDGVGGDVGVVWQRPGGGVGGRLGFGGDAVGGDERPAAGGAGDEGEAAFVDEPVVAVAGADEVGQAGGPVVGPVFEVVDLGAFDSSGFAADVDGGAVDAVDHHAGRAVAGEPQGGGWADPHGRWTFPRKRR